MQCETPDSTAHGSVLLMEKRTGQRKKYTHRDAAVFAVMFANKLFDQGMKLERMYSSDGEKGSWTILCSESGSRLTFSLTFDVLGSPPADYVNLSIGVDDLMIRSDTDLDVVLKGLTAKDRSSSWDALLLPRLTIEETDRNSSPGSRGWER